MISGLNRTAFGLAVYASQGRLPAHHARLASGCWPGSAGRDWLPAGFRRKVSHLWRSPFPELLGAMPVQLFTGLLAVLLGPALVLALQDEPGVVPNPNQGPEPPAGHGAGDFEARAPVGHSLRPRVDHLE